jgi:hypothetical protein
MATYHEARRFELAKNIGCYRTLYEFRLYLDSLDKDMRQQCFKVSRDYLENEYKGPLAPGESLNLLALVNHWSWEQYEKNQIEWWTVLSKNHLNTEAISKLISLWIPNC